MASVFGKKLKLTVFGQSHGEAVGVTIDGLPVGETIDSEELQAFLNRRRPGGSPLVSSRQEADRPVFLSGLEQGKIAASPLCAVIENGNVDASDYEGIKTTPRPGHADYTAYLKWHGLCDMDGGGHFSGRLTAPLCVAGGIAKQILARREVFAGAHLLSVAKTFDAPFPSEPGREFLETVGQRDFPVIDEEKGKAMAEVIAVAMAEGDSVGGVIECAVIGAPADLEKPVFDGVKSQLANAIFGIPAVKGLSFTDPKDGTALVLQVAVKPTPSICKEQDTVDLRTMQPAKIKIDGRHDPCIALRAVPVVEAVVAVVLLDMLLAEGKIYGNR